MNEINTLGKMNKEKGQGEGESENRKGKVQHDSFSTSKRTALRPGSDSGSAMIATRAGAESRSLPKIRANSLERAELLVGVGGGMLDATVDALAVSGVTLELVAAVFSRVFLSAERAGGGGRGI